MIVRATIAISVVAGIAAVSTSCSPMHNSVAEAAPDSLAGTVSVTGTSFEKRIVLRSGDSSVRLSATASDSAALTRLGGVEVVVTGKRTADVLQVERFSAVRVAGSPVVDGVLKDDGGRLVLETHQGRLQLGNPPGALRAMLGARVWIGGPLDVGPNVFGVIVPPR